MNILINNEPKTIKRLGKVVHGFEACHVYENGSPVARHSIPVQWLNNPSGGIKTGGHIYSTFPVDLKYFERR